MRAGGGRGPLAGAAQTWAGARLGGARPPADWPEGGHRSFGRAPESKSAAGSARARNPFAGRRGTICIGAGAVFARPSWRPEASLIARARGERRLCLRAARPAGRGRARPPLVRPAPRPRLIMQISPGARPPLPSGGPIWPLPAGSGARHLILIICNSSGARSLATGRRAHLRPTCPAAGARATNGPGGRARARQRRAGRRPAFDRGPKAERRPPVN